jgi:hypothetical protein
MLRDSRDYHVLENAVSRSKDIDGMTCEIGVREGGGTQCILDTLLKHDKKKVHIAIDPFGNIEYQHWETKCERLNYTNAMKNRMLSKLYDYCWKNDLEVLFFPLQDTEFFQRYGDGVPVYNNFKTLCNTYSLVFFDGPHTTALVKDEFDFFKNRVAIGGCIVFDDVDQYPHMKYLDEYIRDNGFELLDQTAVKASYIKVK